jgi:anthranilate phosphoribosyltransferase
MITDAIAKAVNRQDLTEAEMIATMNQIMQGEASGAQIGGFLMALRMKGETVEEITGAARVMRAKCNPVQVASGNGPLVDTCGTGGDGKGTFNVSTITAFVVAGAGLKVAKHGNRSVSSKCGSADLMEALGVKLSLTPEQVGRCIDETGIGFMFAPGLHPAMKHAIGPRQELKQRTVFNLLGPLTNPAGAQVQVVGVYDPELVEPLARVLGNLGGKSAYVVHGEGGLDEISICGETRVARLKDGQVSSQSITPEDLGLASAGLDRITGGSVEQNLDIALDILKGGKGPKRDMVLMNAAAAITAAGAADGLKAGVELAAKSIDDGEALGRLKALKDLSNQLGAEA